jgi:hypothetical protein
MTNKIDKKIQTIRPNIFPKTIKQITSVGLGGKGALRTTGNARLNGCAGQNGTKAQLSRELQSLGVNEKGKKMTEYGCKPKSHSYI